MNLWLLPSLLLVVVVIPSSVCGQEGESTGQATRSPSISSPALTFEGMNEQGFEEYLHPKTDIVLVLIPEGEFVMGTPDEEPDRGDDEAQHRVRITRPFLIGKTEVTLAQYQRYRPMHKNGNYARDPKASYHTPERPAVNLSWEDAHAYCEWAGLRLPTEAEWEYVARGGDGRRFPWGDTWPPKEKIGNLGDESARRLFKIKPQRGERGFLKGYEDGHGVTSPVDAFPPNPFGIHGLAGNAVECCADWYAPYAASDGVVENPKGPGEGKYRVLRGGDLRSWTPRQLRCAARRRLPPTLQNTGSGFRVAMTVP